jgi:hypothetical protein
MKRIIIGTALTLLTGLAFAQAMPAQGTMGQMPQPGQKGDERMERNMSPAQFQERKAHIVGELKNHLICVERAQTPEQLHDCRPRREGPPRG